MSVPEMKVLRLVRNGQNTFMLSGETTNGYNNNAGVANDEDTAAGGSDQEMENEKPMVIINQMNSLLVDEKKVDLAEVNRQLEESSTSVFVVNRDADEADPLGIVKQEPDEGIEDLIEHNTSQAIKFEVKPEDIIQDNLDIHDNEVTIKEEAIAEPEEVTFAEEGASTREQADAEKQKVDQTEVGVKRFIVKKEAHHPNRFGVGLSYQELLKIHLDAFLSRFDFSKHPILMLERVDKYWPVPKKNIEEVEVKSEIPDEEEDFALEAEIFEANRDWSKNYRVIQDGENLRNEKPSRKRKSRGSRVIVSDDEASDPDDPEAMIEEAPPSRRRRRGQPQNSRQKRRGGGGGGQIRRSASSTEKAAADKGGSDSDKTSHTSYEQDDDSDEDFELGELMGQEDSNDEDWAMDTRSPARPMMPNQKQKVKRTRKSRPNLDSEESNDRLAGDGFRSEDSSYSSWSPDLAEINEDFRINIPESFLPHASDDENEEESILEEDKKPEETEARIFELGDFKIEAFGDYCKCPKCQKLIKSTFIIRHIKLHDQPFKALKCPFKCQATFSRTNNLYRHMKVVHKEENPYLCAYKGCSEKFNTNKLLRSHILEKHKIPKKDEMDDLENENTKFKCDFPGCEREYGKKQHLKEHFRKHTGEMRYACEVCGERFFVHGHMKRHLYSHTGIKPHACRWKCGAIFASYGGRMKHERAQHSENPYKLECDICGRPFRFEREMDKHKMTHLAPDERIPYRCSFCGIIFESIKHRQRHEQRHKDNDKFECEDCHRMFKNEKNLRHHCKTHHESPAAGKASNGVKKEKKEPPKYPCHMCDIPVMFALTALRRHLARRHSTNYKCESPGCKKTFAKQYQFDAHMKLHRHRSCHLCNKVFKRKQNADIHLMGVHGMTKEDLIKEGR